jgi:hypothetical protein
MKYLFATTQYIGSTKKKILLVKEDNGVIINVITGEEILAPILELTDKLKSGYTWPRFHKPYFANRRVWTSK